MQILVLGMHRSGTSVTARLLNMMGVYFGPEGIEMPAHQTNAKGFWERKDVNELCIRLLRSADCDWHRLSRFSLEQLPPSVLEEFREKARQIILGLDAHRPWFVKEPRLCILAPLWLDLLEVPVCVIVYRSPIEVARSLETRDGLPIAIGLALWERYNAAMLNATRGRRRIQIDHAGLMADPVETVRRLQKDLSELGVRGLRAPSSEEVRAFIDSSLYRAKKEDVRGRLSRAQRKLQKGFENRTVLLEKKTIRFSAESQELLSQHDRWLAAQYKIAALSVEKAKLQKETETVLSGLRTSIAKAHEERRTLEEKLGAQQATIQKRDGLIEVLRDQRKAFEEKLNGQLATIQKCKEQMAALEKKAGAHTASLRESQAQTDELRKKVAQLERRIRDEEKRRVKLDETLQVALKSLTKLGKWSDRLLEGYQRVLDSNRWRIGCWLSLKRADEKSKEAQSLARLVASRPGPWGTGKDVTLASSSNEKPPLLQLGKGQQEIEQGLIDYNKQPEKVRVYNRVAEATSFRRAASARHSLPLPPMPSLENSKVCCIVLHRLGEHHLHNLFSSFLRVNTLNSVEFRVVLHACTDESREVLRSFQDRLYIEVIDCQENYSFAYSNNRAAEATDAEYLVFLNNDIIFQENVVPELLRCLHAPRVALAGLRLSFSLEDSTQSGALQHAGIKFQPDPKNFRYRPFNLGLEEFVAATPQVLEEFPAVTAAMVACRRDLFLAVGGFYEKYSYGYEDVDLCLLFRRLLGLKCVSANYISSIHNESATRKLSDNEEKRQRTRNNVVQLTRRHGWYLRREILADKMSGKLFFSDQPLTIAFAVTDSSPLTAAGDVFTASELAEACREEFGWQTRYLSRQENWYDLAGVDVLVTLLDCYEISKTQHAKPDLIKIAWLRNWFDRWASRPDFDQYDLYLCSSVKSAEWLRKSHHKPAWVFPLATNADKFARGQPRHSLRSDYCFTGSWWQAERDIETTLRPNEIQGAEFAVFGGGWDNHRCLGAYAKGFRPYSEMPDVYASTRIVIDDANHVTKQWASMNSRVFDALAAGALVVTNSELGAAEFFDGQLPSYGSPDELQSLLRHYLHDEEERQRLVAKLRERVVSRHTYRHRARTLKRILINRARRGYRIAFKIGVAPLREAPHSADYKLARSLGRCFAAKGHSFRIDYLGEWERPECFGDDVVVVIRGSSHYRPKPDQINLMWNISHPDKIEEQEYEEFDHVFVASEVYAAKLASKPSISMSALFGCTDPEISPPDSNPSVSEEKLLFGGNSRKRYDEVVHPEERRARAARLPSRVLAGDTIEHHAEAILTKIKELDRRKRGTVELETQPRTSTKLSAEATLPGMDMRLVFYPDYRSTNHYQRLLYEHVGVAIEAGTIHYAIKLVEEKKSVVFHLHWTSVVVGIGGTQDDVERRVAGFLNAVDRFIALGGRLFWTVHNRLSHETPFPQIEAELYSQLARRASAIHVHSARVPALMSDTVRFPPKGVLVAPHGNYIGCFPDRVGRAEARKRLALPEDATVFAFFGQIRDYKGLDDLLAAFSDISRDREDVRLVVAGSVVAVSQDNGGKIAAIRSKIDAVPHVVAHLAFIPDEEVQIYMRAADAAVLPYRAILTSGSAIMCASFGLPVIAPAIGLLDELLTEGKSGVLYDGRQPGGLSEGMRRFMRLDAEARAAMGKAALASARRLSWKETGRALRLEAVGGAVGKIEFIKTSETERRCFVRRGGERENSMAVVVLHYADIDVTLRCVESILAQKDAPVDLFLVSNSDDPGEYLTLCARAPRATVIQAPENLGYGAGNNLSLELIRRSGYSLFGIVNPDMMLDPGVLRRLLDRAERYTGMAMFSTLIVFAHNPDRIWYCGGEVDLEDGVRTRSCLLGEPVTNAPVEPFETDYLPGALIFGRTRVLEDIGLIPEDYFLYFEETDWCTRARRAGLKLMVFPDIVTKHWKASEKDGLPQPYYFYYFIRSSLLFARRYMSDGVAQSAANQQEFIDGWMRKIGKIAPDKVPAFAALGECALRDGLAGQTGKVDLAMIAPRLVNER